MRSSVIQVHVLGGGEELWGRERRDTSRLPELKGLELRERYVSVRVHVCLFDGG